MRVNANVLHDSAGSEQSADEVGGREGECSADDEPDRGDSLGASPDVGAEHSGQAQRDQDRDKGHG